MARTLAELIARARFLADQQRSRFVTDADAKEAVNAGWGELYGILVDTFEDYFVTEAEITLVAGTEEYDLPDGDPDPVVFKLRGVDLDEGGEFSPLRPFSWSERVRYAAPDATGTVRITYVPIRPELVEPVVAPAELGVSEIDTLPRQVKPPWDEFIAVEAAIQMLAKEQNESPYLIDKKEKIRRDIVGSAPKRDADEAPRMIVRTRHLDDFDGEDADYARFRASPDGHGLRYALKDEKIIFRSSGEW